MSVEMYRDSLQQQIREARREAPNWNGRLDGNYDGLSVSVRERLSYAETLLRDLQEAKRGNSVYTEAGGCSCSTGE